MQPKELWQTGICFIESINQSDQIQISSNSEHCGNNHALSTKQRIKVRCSVPLQSAFFFFQRVLKNTSLQYTQQPTTFCGLAVESFLVQSSYPWLPSSSFTNTKRRRRRSTKYLAAGEKPSNIIDQTLCHRPMSQPFQMNCDVLWSFAHDECLSDGNFQEGHSSLTSYK